MLAGVVRKARPDPVVPLLVFVDSNLPVGDVISEAVGVAAALEFGPSEQMREDGAFRAACMAFQRPAS